MLDQKLLNSPAERGSDTHTGPGSLGSREIVHHFVLSGTGWIKLDERVDVFDQLGAYFTIREEIGLLGRFSPRGRRSGTLPSTAGTGEKGSQGVVHAPHNTPINVLWIVQTFEKSSVLVRGPHP